MCKQTVPRFGMSIREILWNTISLPLTNEFDKGDVMQILTVFRHVYTNTKCFRVTNEYDRGAVINISTLFGQDHHIACRSML